jgi:hypothetical protein
LLVINTSTRFTIKPEYTAQGARYRIIDTEESDPSRMVAATHPTDRAAERHADLLNRFDIVNR